jgi:hypothetical protein
VGLNGEGADISLSEGKQSTPKFALTLTADRHSIQRTR